MNKVTIKKSLTVAITLGVVLGASFVLNGLTGEKVVASSKAFTVQSSIEMEETNINSQVAGQVQQLNIKEGDSVKKGQVLAIINSDTLKAQKQQAEAGITTIQGQILSAQSSCNLAKLNLDRMATLYESGAVSASALDSAKAQYDVASASLVTLQGQLDTTKAKITEVGTYLNKTKIVAPTDGIITEVNVDNGELVSSGLPIAVITDTSNPWVLCNVMEKDLSKVSLGKPVKISFQAYPHKIYNGVITKINKSPDFAVKRATNANGEFDVLAFGVRVELPNIDVPLYAGMTVIADFGEDTVGVPGDKK